MNTDLSTNSEVRIAAIGTYVPLRRESNLELLEGFGVDKEFLQKRIGVISRSVKDEGEQTSDLCVKAFRDLRPRALDGGEIQLACVVTQNPDCKIPHTAAVVHQKLGLSATCMTFDISQGCAGYVHGIAIATALMDHLRFDHGLVFTCDPYSQIVDRRDKNTALFFGDAASVSYLARSGQGYAAIDSDFGNVPGSASCLKCDERLVMNGRQVFVNAAKEVPASIQRVLNRNGMAVPDVDLFLLHPGSRHIIETIKKTLGLDGAKVPFEMVEHGNTISSSIPLMLKRRLDRPEHRLLLLSGFGVGFTWGTSLMRLIA